MYMLGSWVHVVIPTLFVLICLLLIMVILLQKGRGGGLSGAFGGTGGYSAFGAKTGDYFTWITVGLTALFVLVAMLGNWFYVPAPAVSPDTEEPAVTSPPPGAEDGGAGGETTGTDGDAGPEGSPDGG